MNLTTKKFVVSVIVGGLLMVAGCGEATSTVEKVTKDVTEAIQVETTKDNEYLLLVKNGNFFDYPDYEVGEAFANYFSSPKWKYFESDTGEHIVEFTGHCTYMDAKVKATLQFIVEEDSDEFEAGALDFNGVPQVEFVKLALLESVFDEMSEETSVSAYETSSDSEMDLAVNEDDPFERAMNGYLVEIDTDTIGNIFNESLFEGPSWTSKNEPYFIFTGNYRGELVEGEPSYLEVAIIENTNGDFTIDNLKFNGDDVSDEGFDYIIDLLYSTTSN